MEKINHLGIDCETRSTSFLINRLKRLKTTKAIYCAGFYHAAHEYTQIWLDTTWTQDELDDWLYRIKGDFDYEGTFERKENQVIE